MKPRQKKFLMQIRTILSMIRTKRNQEESEQMKHNGYKTNNKMNNRFRCLLNHYQYSMIMLHSIPLNTLISFIETLFINQMKMKESRL